jgi:excisionase family DNA binding protein
MSVMVIGVVEAANRLGISERRVRELIMAGDLDAVRVSGRYAIEEDTLDRLTEQGRPVGVRGFSRRIGWAAAALADGVRPAWVSQSELSRLRRRLSRPDIDTDSWRARLTARAAFTGRYRISSSNLQRLLDTKQVTRTGVSARNLVTDRQIGLGDGAVWLVHRSELVKVVTDFGLLHSRSGNVIVRTADVDGMMRTGENGDTYRLMVAADLLDSTDARGQLAGAQLLHATLAEHRWQSI